VSNPAAVSGKLPDKGLHETLPAKAFLITEVTAIFDTFVQIFDAQKRKQMVVGKNDANQPTDVALDDENAGVA
jgi:hypothetical protein